MSSPSSQCSFSSQFYEAIKNVALYLVKQHFSDDVNRVVGLGSGRTVAAVIREMANLPYKGRLEFVATSIQIKKEAENIGLKIVDENRTPDIDIVLDGADQIDSKFYMIKGGGGALLKEKILMSACKKVIVVADSTKFVDVFSIPIPVEVHQFARSVVWIKLQEAGGRPSLRTIANDYPFITENGNIILDTSFSSFIDMQEKEAQLKSIPGVLEVGIFTRRADIYYKIKSSGSFEILQF
jgi:ribose 5-phosphate isomerase A